MSATVGGLRSYPHNLLRLIPAKGKVAALGFAPAPAFPCPVGAVPPIVATELMEVRINHTPFSVPERATLPDALRAAGIEETRGIAVALNDEVIPKSSWPDRPLADGDRLTIIRAAQGG